MPCGTFQSGSDSSQQEVLDWEARGEWQVTNSSTTKIAEGPADRFRVVAVNLEGVSDRWKLTRSVRGLVLGQHTGLRGWSVGLPQDHLQPTPRDRLVPTPLLAQLFLSDHRTRNPLDVPRTCANSRAPTPLLSPSQKSSGTQVTRVTLGTLKPLYSFLKENPSGTGILIMTSN